MNVNELSTKLKDNKIPAHWYLIGEVGVTNDKTCLRCVDGKWQVYYSERGKKYKIKAFDSETDACEELMSRMLVDLRRLQSKDV